MTDMLVRLYELPDLSGYTEKMEKIRVWVRCPNVWEKPLLLDWVNEHFSLTWALECEAAFAVRPPSCFIAVKDDALIGFACYDCTRLNFFGPTGVADYARGKGVAPGYPLISSMKPCCTLPVFLLKTTFRIPVNIPCMNNDLSPCTVLSRFPIRS